MDIQCIACTPPTKWANEAEYQDHLISFHGTASTDEAVKLERAKRKNTPVELPPGIPPSAAPTPEFVQTMNEIEKASIPNVPLPVGPTLPPQPKPEQKPLILKYKFDGNCPKCNNPVRTIVNDFEGKLIANAYCMFCDETVQQIPVERIPKTEKIENFQELVEKEVEKTKRKGKNG